MTPSRLVKVATTILRMVVSCGWVSCPEDERRRPVPTGHGKFFRRGCLHHVLSAAVHVPVSRHEPCLAARKHMEGSPKVAFPSGGRFQAREGAHGLPLAAGREGGPSRPCPRASVQFVTV